MPCFVYILQSTKDGTYYIGSTNDLSDRIIRHNQGRSKYTKSKRPWEVVYSEEFDDRASAVNREKELKSWKSKHLIEKPSLFPLYQSLIFWYGLLNFLS